jgi:hypothetical protein
LTAWVQGKYMVGIGRKRESRLGGALAGLVSLLAILTATAAQAGDSAKDDVEATSDLGFFGRFYQAYAVEWGKNAPPADPNAPTVVSRRPEPFPPAPTTYPPYPFTDWPYGGASTIGASVPNSVDSPLMAALAPTSAGKWLNDNHIQIYGWVEAGGNISNAKGSAKDGNFPAGYMFKPDTVELNQAVLYIERVPDTVQQDHVDWGFRLSGIYGEDYRYTTANGLASYQLLKHNFANGYDLPMEYGEVYIPKVADGLVIRAGRYISVPDIEAQLAPNNYMYSHSMTYTYDNFTNTGVIASLQANKNWMVQAGISAGTETVPWNTRDPGTQPTLTACARWNSDDSWHNINVCANGINSGEYGYNNLQWYGFTTYHKLSEKWHLSGEFWSMHENDVASNGVNGTPGTSPFDPGQPDAIPNGFAQPFKAYCPPGEAKCTANEWSALLYLNYRYSDLDNFTVRTEYFSDENGQRTGVKADYDNYAISWQHFLSPNIYIRPEVAWYNTVNGVKAFGRDSTGSNPTQSSLAVFSVDTIIRF